MTKRTIQRVNGPCSLAFRPLRRQRIERRLAEAASHRLTLLLAPAGFGKSVAVRHYLEHGEARYARVVLRQEHATLAGFSRGLRDALSRLCEPPEQNPRELEATAGDAAWLEFRAQHLRGVVVIDDLHVAADPAICDFLARLVERSCVGLRWIIAGRSARKLPVASWYSYALMDPPIDEQELAFSREEALELAHTLGGALDEAEVEAALRVTRGWPVAFVTMLRDAERRRFAHFSEHAAKRVMWRLLNEQVLTAVPERHRSFLLATSVYPNLDPKLLEACGFTGARELIADLIDRGAFVISEYDGTHTYHPIFREFLERHFRAQDQAGFEHGVAGVAHAMEQRGDVAEALQRFLEIGAQEAVIRILREHGGRLVDAANGELVMRALESIVPDLRNGDPICVVLLACIASRRAEMDRASVLFARALGRAADARTATAIALKFALHLLRCQDGATVVTLIEPMLSEQGLCKERLALLSGLLAAAHAMLGDHTRARRLSEQALSLSAEVECPELQVTISHYTAYALWRCGASREARELAARATSMAQERGFLNLAAMGFGLRHDIALEVDDDIDGAVALLRSMEDCAARGGDRFLEVSALISMCNVTTERGDEACLVALDRRLTDEDISAAPRFSASLRGAQALRRAWRGEFAVALQLVDGTAEEQMDPPRRAVRWSEIAAYAAAAGYRQRAEAAFEFASREVNAGPGDSPACSRRLARSLALMALSSMLIGQVGEAWRLLEECMRLSRSNANPRGRAIAKAVQAFGVYSSSGHELDAFRAELAKLRACGCGGFARLLEATQLAGVSVDSRLALLTPTELDVLRAVGSGMSSRAVAEQTSRSVHTINVHVRTILRKLGLHSRREIVGLARELGLDAQRDRSVPRESAN